MKFKIPRRRAPSGTFTGGLVGGKRYTDIHTATLRVSGQYQKVLPKANVDFRISWEDSRFRGNYFELSWRKSLQNAKSMPGNPRKGESNSEGTKQIDWEVIIHSNRSSCSNSPLLSCSTSAHSELICHNSFKEKVTNTVEAKKEL